MKRGSSNPAGLSGTIGRKSMMNDSGIDDYNMSGDAADLSGTLARTLSVDKQMTGKAISAKARTFNHTYMKTGYTIMLEMIKATNYDQIEDMRKLEPLVRTAIDELKDKWQTNDVDKIKALIKRCVIRELTRLEERKLSNR